MALQSVPPLPLSKHHGLDIRRDASGSSPQGCGGDARIIGKLSIKRQERERTQSNFIKKAQSLARRHNPSFLTTGFSPENLTDR
jgi:hypothetical protein